MRNARPSPRRPGWVALLAATGIVLGGAYAVRQHRRHRDDRRPAVVETPPPPPADEPPTEVTPDSPEKSRPPVRPGFVLALRFWLIQEAAWRTSAGDVPVTLQGRYWDVAVASLAERASALDDFAIWRLVDSLSVEPGGASHPTLGFPRA